MSSRSPAGGPGSPRPKAPHTRVFRVRLHGSPYAWMGTPPSGEHIWREIEVRAEQTLGDLGEAIPGAFDFDGDHLWSFFLSGQAWDEHSEYARADLEGGDADPKRPADGLPAEDAPAGREFLFLFDYGDEWHFGVTLARTGEVEPGAAYPRVVAAHGEPVAQDPEPGGGPDEDEDEGDRGDAEDGGSLNALGLLAARLAGVDPGGVGDDGLDDDDEDDRLTAASARLVEHFESWATVRGVPEQARIAGRLVDFKVDDEESPSEWTPEALKKLLLEWCPEELVLDPGEEEQLLPTVRAFLTFLDDTGQLGPPGTRLRALEATLDWIAPRLGERMRDTSKFGPVKRAILAMRAVGVDPDDPDAAGEFLSGWEPADDDLAGPPPALPVARIPPTEELRAAAAQSPTVTQLTRLAEWVGEGGRKLTARGNLTIADGKELSVTLGLATADEVAERPVRSANDLPGIALAVAWAKETGLVRARGGRLVQDPDQRHLLSDPQELAGRALDALTDLGDVALPLAAEAPSYVEDVESALLELLVLLYEDDEPVSLGEFTAHVWQDHVLPELDEREPERPDTAAGADFPLGLDLDLGLDLEKVDDELEFPRLATTMNVVALAGHLQQLGIVTLEHDGEPGDGPAATTGDPDAGDRAGPDPELDEIQVRLTPLGVWKTNRLLRANGATAPVLGELAGADAATLIDGCARYDEASCHAELRGWCERRGSRAAAELAAYARDQAPDHEHLMLALLGLELAGPAAHDEVRALLSDPRLRAHAQFWLVRNGAENERILDSDATVWVLADVLAAVLDADGPASMVEQLGDLGPPELQLAALRDLEQTTHPRVAPLLETIGKAHPDDEVARAARKAAFKLGPATGPQDEE